MTGPLPTHVGFHGVVMSPPDCIGPALLPVRLGGEGAQGSTRWAARRPAGQPLTGPGPLLLRLRFPSVLGLLFPLDFAGF